MNQPKKSESLDQAILRTHYKILPHKRHFITLQSDYDYGDNYDVIPYLVKNPKWCHLQLKLAGDFDKYKQLRRAKSLRLRSLRLESYSISAQGCGDQINAYFGELDTLIRAGHTLKNLSLSVALNDRLVKKYNKQDAYHRLEKFVKKQKHLDEFAFYNGTWGNAKRSANWLKYLEKTLKVLTVENLSVDDLFKRYTFPKLEVLRFEYILFYESESSFNLSVVMKCFEQIFSLKSLQALKFVQYQRYGTGAYYEVDCGEDEEKCEGEIEEVEEEEEEEEDEEEEEENDKEKEREENENENVNENENENENEMDIKNENENEGEQTPSPRNDEELIKENEKYVSWNVGDEDDDYEEEKNENDEEEEENKDNQDENDAENGPDEQTPEVQDPGFQACGSNVWNISSADGFDNLMKVLKQSFKAEKDGRKKTRQIRQKKYDMTKLQEFPIKFFEVLRESLDQNKNKQLKVKYHKQDESNIKKKKKEFERIFTGLSEGQSFEYEIRQIKSFGTNYGWKSKTKTLKSSIFM